MYDERLSELNDVLHAEANTTLPTNAWTAVELPDPPLSDHAAEVAFHVPRVLSATACGMFVRLAEAVGFRPALLSEDSKTGGYPDPDVRQCGMVQVDDAALATHLWARIRPMLQTMSWEGLAVAFPSGTNSWQPSGVSHELRILRYGAGDYFKPHTDGFLRVSSQERSFLTVLVYLNDLGEPATVGGGTRFLPTRSTAPPTVVRPVLGSMLCFDHDLYHEGEALQSGWKYVLRTDIVFRTHSTDFGHGMVDVPEHCKPQTVLAAAQAENWDRLEMLLEQNPAGAKERDSDVMHELPLHFAIKECAPATTVHKLVLAWPQALHIREPGGDWMLHYAIRSLRDVEQRGATADEIATRVNAIGLLLDTFPEAAKERDGDGGLALHLALKHKAPACVVERLRGAFPEGPQLFVLEAALNRDWPTVTRLLEMNPRGGRERTVSGTYPLHLALEQDAPEDVVCRLFKSFPEAAKLRDEDGMYPLDLGSHLDTSTGARVPQTEAACTLQALLVSQGQSASKSFIEAALVHVISSRFHGVSRAAAAQAKSCVEALGAHIACFNPNADNNKLAAGEDAEADAIWLKRWREMLCRAAATGGCVLQILSVSEGLSHMQDAEADMASDKRVPIIVLPCDQSFEFDLSDQISAVGLAQPRKGQPSQSSTLRPQKMPELAAVLAAATAQARIDGVPQAEIVRALEEAAKDAALPWQD